MNQELIYQAILIFFVIYFLYQITLFIYRITHRGLLDRYNSERKLKKISWEDFERLCMELFAKDGWQIKGNKSKGADGGVDIWMQKSQIFRAKKAIVQCKRYKNVYVSIKVVREMYGLMYEYEVDEVYIVTTSFFTKECYKFVKDKNIILIDKLKLLELINSKT
jgi:restriction system protein